MPSVSCSTEYAQNMRLFGGCIWPSVCKRSILAPVLFLCLFCLVWSLQLLPVPDEPDVHVDVKIAGDGSALL